MTDKIVIKDNNELKYFYSLNDVPDVFDHLISYEPEIPSSPHTNEEHKKMEMFPIILQNLLNRERKS